MVLLHSHGVIKRNGMPLPVFVRYDDVEYGIRCNPTFMTMNGLCIWHSKFEIRYNAAVERYQSIRNGMIAQMTTGLAPSIDTFLRELHDQVDLELKKVQLHGCGACAQGLRGLPQRT